MKCPSVSSKEKGGVLHHCASVASSFVLWITRKLLFQLHY